MPRIVLDEWTLMTLKAGGNSGRTNSQRHPGSRAALPGRQALDLFLEAAPAVFEVEEPVAGGAAAREKRRRRWPDLPCREPALARRAAPHYRAGLSDRLQP